MEKKNLKDLINIKKAHIYDGAALTKYLFWLKKNFYKKKIIIKLLYWEIHHLVKIQN